MREQGIGWQYLRSLSLDAIPPGARAYYTAAIPFHEWRQRGSFTVAQCTKKSIVLESAGVEIGAALLADSELLADHAAEHAAHVYDVSTSGRWSSPAWDVVTAYYWAFFSVLAITRLTGRTVVFLDHDTLSDLRVLGGSATQPGAGALFMDVGPYTSATLRSISLRPSKSQMHDAVWRLAGRLVSDVVQHTDRRTNPLEHHFWSMLKGSNDKFGPDWPSKLRNSVNYRPGCGYREVTRQPVLDIGASIRGMTPMSLDSLGDRFDLAVREVGANTPSKAVKDFSRLLGIYAIALSAIFDLLHREIVERPGGDRRWRDLRRRFLRSHYSAVHPHWPFQALL